MTKNRDDTYRNAYQGLTCPSNDIIVYTYIQAASPSYCGFCLINDGTIFSAMYTFIYPDSLTS